MSGTPNKACPFAGTTKMLHILHLLWCSVFTLHMPNCVIVVLFYVLTGCLYFLLLPIILFPQEIMFCICVKALCFHHCLCLFYVVLLSQLALLMFFRCAAITEHLLIKLMEFIFTASIWSSSWYWSGSRFGTILLFMLLQMSLKSGWSCCTLHISYHMPGTIWLNGWNHNNGNSASQVLWHVFAFLSQFVSAPFSLSLSYHTLVSFKLFIIVEWAFGPHFFAHARHCTLVTSLLSSVWWVPYLFLAAFHCHLIHVWTAPSIVYFFITSH